MDKYRYAESHTAFISGLAALVGVLIALFDDTKITHSTFIALCLCLFVAPFQIFYAEKNIIAGRNYSNMINACVCMYVSTSLTLGYGDVSAIGGYGTCGLLSVVYWWATSRMMKNGS